jgi:catechol 2,3-dioxygenase
MIRPRELAHIVLRVRDAQASKAFYMKAFGLRLASESPDGRFVFLSLGEDHHDIALNQHGVTGEPAARNQPGLEHIAFKLDSFADVQAAYREWQAMGFGPDPILHNVSRSIYIRDPDGNRVELYCDRRPGGFESWANVGDTKIRADIETGPMDMETGEVVSAS